MPARWTPTWRHRAVDAPRRRRLKPWARTALRVLAGAAALGILWLLVLRPLSVRLATAGTPGARVEVPDWVEEDLLPINSHSRPGRPLQAVNAVVIHYVGNPGTSARANRNYFANLAVTRETYASSHFIVGLEGEVIQCVPLSEIAFCSNDRNDDTIAIEVCHPDESGQFSPETMDSLIRLTAFLCGSFDLEEDQIIRHYDVSGKLCPRYYVEHQEAWEALKDQVAAAIPAGAAEPSE